MSVAGTYEITIKTPMGAQSGTLTVIPDGADGFSGTVANAMMGSLATQSGRVAGNRLSWTMAMTAPMPMTLECEATVNGDSIEGAVKAGAFGSMELSGKRADR